MVKRLILFVLLSNANYSFSQELIQLVQVDSVAILFLSDSANSTSYQAPLNKLKKYAKGKFELTVKAYTDTKGSLKYNSTLSQKRLDFVT